MSSITQAKAEAQKLIKQYNKLQAEAKQADAADAASKAAEAEKLVSQISALQGAIAKLQAKDRETTAKKPPPAKSGVGATSTSSAAIPTSEEVKQSEAEKRALEMRINRIEDAQRKTRAQIDQLTRAKAELARLREEAERNVTSVVKERRQNEEKLQQEIAKLIEKKEAEHLNLKQEMEAIRNQALKEAELLKIQRDAAKAMVEKQKKLESERLQVRRRSSGHKGLWIGIAIGGVMSVIMLVVLILLTPLGDSIMGKPAVSTTDTGKNNTVTNVEKEKDKKKDRREAEAEEKNVPKFVARPIKSFQDRLSSGGAGPAMMQLPEGTFMMGSKNSSLYQDERPQHSISLQGFSISKYEITFNDYDLFANNTEKPLPSDGGWGRENHPVITVSWNEAVEYAKWLTEQTGHQYRLPSEREWEYAAGAGTDTPYWWGYELEKNRANCANCGSRWDGSQTAPVGSFSENPFGLYDTIGNVLEWTSTCYHSSYQGSPAFGQNWEGGNCSKRMVRSSSFQTSEKDLRTTKRSSYSPTTQMDTLGFRVVRVD